MLSHRTFSAVFAAAVVAALVGCSTGADAASGGGGAKPAAAVSATGKTAPAVASPPAPPHAASSASVSTGSSASTSASTGAAPAVASHRPAVLAIPEIGLKDLRVVPYEGITDDRAGTRIQDQGFAASPYGGQGAVGPGEIGNYLVTAHRLSAGGPLRDLPSLDAGDSVFVTADGVVYEYRITETRKTSFRSERSLSEQRAAVPGKPGVKPTRAMITISTCATPEDNAAGNFWRDDRGNPEHRIDKVGALVSTRPAADAANAPSGS
ncbi:class E sortase [Streptomyces sp. NBC_00239]|uniref:class E sortase n=1 Tax=Streptomyces sp. NBC_00239 TaxID=2903640 RepID=UPI002E2E6985|nr:class E sortase [Streptomyces sp. NBC_00239]